MNTMTFTAGSLVAVLSAAALHHGTPSTGAAGALPSCGPAAVIPGSTGEPPARLVLGAPLPGPLATRGVVVIPYCAEHMRLLPVFGDGALSATPRIGHVHVTLDEAPWHWADASGTPIILRGLPAGAHTVRIDLLDADHHQVDTAAVSFAVPAPSRSAAHP